MKFNIFFYVLFLLWNLNASYGQNNSVTVPMSASSWDLSERAEYTFEEFEGRETLLLNGKVTVKGHQFSNGIIEVDIYANEARSFAGIIFRKQKGAMEETYMRLHKSKQPDAVQYSPIYNYETNWQLYREYQANVMFKTKGWNKLRVEVNGTMAQIFVNNEKVLNVSDLKTGFSIGQVGLLALFNNRFSNFRITDTDTVELPKDTIKKRTNSNIIKKWNVTQAFPYIEGTLNPKDFPKLVSKSLNTEASGLLPISKYIERTSVGNFEANKEEYAVVSTTIVADTNEVRQFFFDYSDKIFVYLNGNLIFSGNNAFRLKGVQYQGHMNINANSLYLALLKGKNTLHCVVVDKANGWGIIGGLKK
jgi:3-keto-disaccharide hydrolase